MMQEVCSGCSGGKVRGSGTGPWEQGEALMAKTANADVAARQRARQRLTEMRKARAERDRRIEDAVTAGLAAADERAAADRRYELAVEAARLAQLEAEQAAERERASADEKTAAAVVALRTDGVTANEIADLLTLPIAEVRRMVRSSSGAGGDVPDEAPAGGSSDSDGGMRAVAEQVGDSAGPSSTPVAGAA